MSQARRKRRGMAVGAVPNICRKSSREREKEEKGGKKERREEKEKRGEKGKKGRGEQRERCNCKTPPWNCQKTIKDTERGGLIKSRDKEEEETEKAGENILAKNRLRCIFYSSV